MADRLDSLLAFIKEHERCYDLNQVFVTTRLWSDGSGTVEAEWRRGADGSDTLAEFQSDDEGIYVIEHKGNQTNIIEATEALRIYNKAMENNKKEK